MKNVYREEILAKTASSDFHISRCYESEGRKVNVGVSVRFYYESEGIKITEIAFSECTEGSAECITRQIKSWDDELGYNWDEFVQGGWVKETTKDDPDAFAKNGKWYKTAYVITE